MTREEFILAVQQLGFKKIDRLSKNFSFVGHFCFDDGSKPDMILINVYSDSYVEPTLVAFWLCNRLPDYDKNTLDYSHIGGATKFLGENSYKEAYAYLTED